MSDKEEGGVRAPDTRQLPDPDVDKASRWLPSLVWLIPLLAALIGAGLAAKSILDQGPTVTVSFKSAEGLEPGKTKVKYKDVDIGQVRAINLGEDLSRVLVTIEMSKEARRFATADSRFWVVRPQIGASGVTGLGTLLSGAYIGVDTGKSEAKKDSFTGMESPPAVDGDQKGKLFTLHADSLGSVDVGSPLFFHRLRVGKVVSFGLDKDGNGITMTVFVNAPYDQFVGKNARWWHASGVDVRLDSNGFKLNTQSLAALLVGGIAFEAENGRKPELPAPANTSFRLAPDEASAMRAPDGEAITTVFYFDQSLRGLQPGATVDFRGIVLGEVRSVGIEFDPIKKNFRMPVTVNLYPARLGMRFQTAVADAEGSSSHQMLERMVSRGLRAQLRTGNLLTSQLYIALDFFPKAPKLALDTSKYPLEVPTVPNTLDELQTQVASIARKLDQIPFADIGNNLNATIKEANALFKQLDSQVVPEMRGTLTAAKNTFGTAEQVLQKDSPLQSDVRQALQQLTQTLQSLNALTDYLERHPESLIRGKKGDEQK